MSEHGDQLADIFPFSDFRAPTIAQRTDLEAKWPDFWSFGDTYLHLTRGRVPESFWKPHQSKALNFLHRNYNLIFFSTPKKIFCFEVKFIFRKYFRPKIFFCEKMKIFKKIRFWLWKKSGIFFGRKIFLAENIFENKFYPETIFFFGVEKKMNL